MAKSNETLETEIALLTQFNQDIVRPFIEEQKKHNATIIKKLEDLDYVHRTEFNEHKEEVQKSFRELKRRTWVQNSLSAMFGAILALLISYVFKDLIRG